MEDSTKISIDSATAKYASQHTTNIRIYIDGAGRIVFAGLDMPPNLKFPITIHTLETLVDLAITNQAEKPGDHVSVAAINAVYMIARAADVNPSEVIARWNEISVTHR